MANSKKRILKVGIGGLGRSGYSIHAKWLRQATNQYKIVAVSDEMPKRLAEVTKELDCRGYRDYRKLLAEEELDLFVNALPTFLHPKGTIDAFAAGHNVVCEKPLATKVKDFDAMVAASRKARKLFAPFQNSRFYPFFVKMQEIIASGVLGEILYIRSNWSGFGRRWDWQTLQKNWGGNLNNTGPHPLDHAVMLFGEKRRPQVCAKMLSGPGSTGDADDFSLVLLHGKNAPTIEILLNSYEAYKQGDQYCVCGTQGSLAGNTAELRWMYFDPSKAPKQRPQPSWAKNRAYCSERLPWKEKTWKKPESKLGAFEQNSRSFYKNIYDVLTRKANLVVTPAQVRKQVEILEECHRQNPLPRLQSKRRKK